MRLPITDEDVIKTLRATGDIVSDFIRVAEDSDIWEVQFKRRVVGTVPFRIEYERRGERISDRETLEPTEFPQARQISYFFGIRAGGRLGTRTCPVDARLAASGLECGSAVAERIRQSDGASDGSPSRRAKRDACVFSSIVIRWPMRSKLRVAQGTLTTVLSPTGDQLTSVDVTMEVIQRSSLTVGLPIRRRTLQHFCKR